MSLDLYDKFKQLRKQASDNSKKMNDHRERLLAGRVYAEAMGCINMGASCVTIDYSDSFGVELANKYLRYNGHWLSLLNRYSISLYSNEYLIIQDPWWLVLLYQWFHPQYKEGL